MYYNYKNCCKALIYIMKGERKGIRKLNISYGASGGNRTPIHCLEGSSISRYTTPAYGAACGI